MLVSCNNTTVQPRVKWPLFTLSPVVTDGYLMDFGLGMSELSAVYTGQADECGLVLS